MIRDEELNDSDILETLQRDPIERNQQLGTFIDLLNSISKNSILAVDGDWGSGKSVFVRQLEYLNQKDTTDIRSQSLDQTRIEDFQNNYIVYRFNAWENDYHDDPLQSILFNLINDMWSPTEKVADQFIRYSEAFIQSLSKTLTLGLYDPEEIRSAKSIADLASTITTAAERKKAVDDIISNFIDLKGKKLLFIIDELDRCKPTFAVDLLETIKHYYTNDKMVFLLATNNQQLAHTVKKVYGESFDGGGYLNRFYDLIFDLPPVPVQKYIEYLGHKPGSGYFKDGIPCDVANYLEMSMRQVNRYYSSLRLIQSYLGTINGRLDISSPEHLVKYGLTPLAYGLRITNGELYKSFINGRGSKVLAELYERSEHLKIIAGRISEHQGTPDPDRTLVATYEKLFSTSPGTTARDHHIRESAESFKRVILLMNASGAIDEQPKEIEQ